MSKDEETPEKPAEEPKPAPKQRKIVRRSVSTRDNPAFAEAPPTAAEEGKAAPPAAAGADAPGAAPASPASAESAPAAQARPGPAPAAPGARPRAVFDARAPRPRPGEPGSAPRPREGRPARPPRGGDRGDYRPPPARPIGARPIPGGSRAPALEGGERGERPRERSSGDYRPPPARPIGARPIPGGSRAPASEDRGPRPEGSERRPPRPPREARPEGERPHREHRGHAGPAPRPAPSSTAAAPPPKPAPAPAAPPPAKAAPKPVPVFIPLARAGQVAPASAKPALTPKEALAAKTKAQAAKTVAKPPVSSKPSSGASFAPELVNAGADEAVAALVKAGDAAVALIDAWTAASNAAAVVEAAEAEAAPGAARKAARRALNVLRSRGVTLPTRAKAAKVEERVELVTEADLTPPDASGVLSFTFTRKNATGRYHLAQVLLRDTVGIVQAASGWVSGSQLKEGKARVAESYGMQPVAVPLAWARARIAEARAQNATSGQVLPLGLDGCRDLIEPAPDQAPPHPLADLEADLTSDRAAAAVPMSARLHAEPEFGTWFADRGALQEMLSKVGERLGPSGLSDPAAVSAALDEEANAATDRFFSPEVRAIVAKRMRDTAISIRARKGDRVAAEVLGVARAVVEAGLITSPPREIPFLVAFFQKGLNYLLREGGGQLRVPVPAAAPQSTEAPPA